jgi:hypothetical protein
MRFLHMQKRSTYIGGDKILKELKIKKDNIRNELENSLRLLLIDLRGILLPEVHHTTQDDSSRLGSSPCSDTGV